MAPFLLDVRRETINYIALQVRWMKTHFLRMPLSLTHKDVFKQDTV